MRFIVVIQLIVAVLLSAAILLQSRGTGLGMAFGGEGNIYRTKRGLEKSLFRATIVLAVLFLGSALVNTLAQTPRAPVDLQDSAADVPLAPEASPAPDASLTPGADSSPSETAPGSFTP